MIILSVVYSKILTQMAGKLSGSAPRLLLLSVAVLVMLSAAVVTEDSRQCYWCGPLAEQVHRSRRAPACNAPGNQLTTSCDQGYSYCAIVATAPPYVESRYCVRTYHNECHLLYCNTTRTWKMTCPCKENLCNGPNTERVSAAFADLRKLAEQNQAKRITKRTGQLVTLTKPRTEINLIITNTSDVQENLLNGSFDESSEQHKEQLVEIIVFKESGIINKADNMESDIESTEESITAENTEDTTEDVKMTEIEDDKEKTLTVVTSNELITNIQKPTVISRMDDIEKTREELPTAEALQQNASPIVSEKTIAPTTLNYESTTLITTESIENVTKQQANHKNGKNGNAQKSSSVCIIAYIFVLFLHCEF